jgi:hypothetical protein
VANIDAINKEYSFVAACRLETYHVESMAYARKIIIVKIQHVFVMKVIPVLDAKCKFVKAHKASAIIMAYAKNLMGRPHVTASQGVMAMHVNLNSFIYLHQRKYIIYAMNR